MEDKKILYVSTEVIPYLPETEISALSFEAPKMVNDNGGQIRIFMPRFGNVNERRHQLHEVIRLSGMNLVVNDMDMPLIIKVASIPRERIQVYFIDNEEYFKRKATLTDEDGILFPDNDERAIFFAKGVIETVKKLNWDPDLIHVHGWMASFIPLYLKHYYQNDPLFARSKIVLSVYGKDFEGNLDPELINKILFDEIDRSSIEPLKDPTYSNLMKVAIDHSDAVIFGSKNVPEDLKEYILNSKLPVLPYIERDEFKDAYYNFYSNLMQ